MIVALEGLPGAGKTTTAQLMAERPGVTHVHERSGEHPFLSAFYTDVERYKLETELCFVLLHYHQYRDLEADDGAVMVLDYSPVKDLVFADLNLTGPDYDVFTAVYGHTSGSLPLPDMTVYLDLSVDHTLERIRTRDRPYERAIEPNYIRRLADVYAARMEHLGQKVERVTIEPAWTTEQVAEAVAQAAGLAPPA